jgi:hypothetical protein
MVVEFTPVSLAHFRGQDASGWHIENMKFLNTGSVKLIGPYYLIVNAKVIGEDHLPLIPLGIGRSLSLAWF